MKAIIGTLIAVILTSAAQAADVTTMIKGFNLVENAPYLYDASPTEKTHAQIAVDKAKALGANHIILNLKATMKGPRSSEITPMTPPAERNGEKMRINRLVKYIRSQGMTIGLRPIFFVVGPQGEFPYTETLPDGSKKVWWHGNIQPDDPDRWFESFKIYLDSYLPLAQILKVEEFTVGAELYSMTVGLEDQWKQYPYGFPGRWLQLLRYVRSKLPEARLMYDINFTDDRVDSNGIGTTGGELERWRYRLVDLAEPADPAQYAIWKDLVNFWNELDAIGIDVYRSLASNNQKIPQDYNALVNLLKLRTDSFATQMDNTIGQINMVVQTEKPIQFKEVGFRSVNNGFIDPFAYAGSGTPNVVHQAAALQAYFESFWTVNWPWFKGFSFWEISLDPTKEGVNDNGFSPVGKKQSEDIIKTHFGQP